MSDADIGQNVGTVLAILGAALVWWRSYGPRWKPVTNGSISLSERVVALTARVTLVEKENGDLRLDLAKCNEDRNELRELVTAAVLKELGERDAPNHQGSG